MIGSVKYWIGFTFIIIGSNMLNDMETNDIIYWIGALMCGYGGSAVFNSGRDYQRKNKDS